MSAARIAVVGDVADDHYIELPQQVSADEKTTALSSRHLLGGTGANAAVAAARLGSAVSLHSAVGDDPVGGWLREQLSGAGVRVGGVATVAGASTQALILLRGRHRQVIIERGVADDLRHVAAGDLDAADVIYTSCAAPTLHRLIRQGLGPRLVAGLEAWMVDGALLAALGAVRYVVTNESGFAALGGRAPGVPTIETRGGDGVRLHEPDGASSPVGAHPVEALDATGAGDAFAGALCHYLGAGRTLEAAVEAAVIAAALSTRGFGAQGALPTATEVEGLLSAGAGAGAGAAQATGPGPARPLSSLQEPPS